MVYVALFLFLLGWHCIADYPLQAFLATAKRPDNDIDFPWQIGLFAHAYIHAIGMFVIMGNDLWMLLVQLFAHMRIDYLKCEGRFGADPKRAMWIDQSLHVLTIVAMLVARRVWGL